MRGGGRGGRWEEIRGATDRTRGDVTEEEWEKKRHEMDKGGATREFSVQHADAKINFRSHESSSCSAELTLM